MLREALINLLDFFSSRDTPRAASLEEKEAHAEVAKARLEKYARERAERFEMYNRHWALLPEHRKILHPQFRKVG